MGTGKLAWLAAFCAIALLAGIAIANHLSGTSTTVGAAQVQGPVVCPGSGGLNEAVFEFSDGASVHEGTPKTELARVISSTKLAGSLDRALAAWTQVGTATITVPAGRAAWDLTRSEALEGLPPSAKPSDVRLELWLVDPDLPTSEPAGIVRYELADSGWRLKSYALCSSLLSDVDYPEPTPEELSERELEELREADRLDGINGGKVNDDG